MLRGGTDQGMIRVLGEKGRNIAAEKRLFFAEKVFLNWTGISGVPQLRNTLLHAGNRKAISFMNLFRIQTTCLSLTPVWFW